MSYTESVAGSDQDQGSGVYEEEENYAWNADGEEQILDAHVIPSDSEKSKVLAMFQDLRVEGTFCDVAFLCKGTLFNAHRVVVSGWSRWLRALLSTGTNEEVEHLDFFEADAFSAVLDYMYGLPIKITVDTAEKLLKVVRRLELHGLEQSCWIFLMKAVDDQNCNILHELADRYDCPPLKLAAWRHIQAAISGPMKNKGIEVHKPSGLIDHGTGLTGPGQLSFYRNFTAQERAEMEREAADALFHESTAHMLSSHARPAEDSDNEDEDASQEHKERERDAFRGDEVDLEAEVNKELPATEFVRAWSERLKVVYNECAVDTGTGDIHDGGPVSLGFGQGKHKSMMVNSQSRQSQRQDQEEQSSPSSPARNNNTSGQPAKTKMNVSNVSRHGVNNTPTSGDIDWRSELKGFYIGINLAEKLPFLDEILDANRGKEEAMLSHLMMKYRRVIPSGLAAHLDTLQGFLDAQTESSFQMR